jgi:hypothetical protein
MMLAQNRTVSPGWLKVAEQCSLGMLSCSCSSSSNVKAAGSWMLLSGFVLRTW